MKTEMGLVLLKEIAMIQVGARTSDGDCDGVLTEDDCDDEDVGLLAQSEDGDLMEY